MTIYVGTSGIALPFARKEFPEDYRNTSRLRYYSTLFSSLEVNSSFYKTPQPATLAKWANDVNADFRFTVKLSRAITHAKKLEFDAREIADFFHAASALGDKRGALLVQFPASISAKYLPQVESLLEQIRAQTSGEPWKVAVEFRHTSWYSAETVALLNSKDVSIIIHDMPASATPPDVYVNGTIYLRFHGPLGDYKGSYTDAYIRHWVEWLLTHRPSEADAYVYFNNTMGDAYNNARLFQKLIKQ